MCHSYVQCKVRMCYMGHTDDILLILPPSTYVSLLN